MKKKICFSVFSRSEYIFSNANILPRSKYFGSAFRVLCAEWYRGRSGSHRDL